MDGAAAIGGSVEPVANGAKKPEEQHFDPSRSKELPSDVPLLRFCRLFVLL
jgi:hypothetical protein